MHLTCSGIAIRLRLATRKGEPHDKVVRDIIREIGTIPRRKVGRAFRYDEEAVRLVRQWLYREVGIDFDKPVRANGHSYIVRFLPEDDGLESFAVNEIVA
jgi:hypothetical protein